MKLYPIVAAFNALFRECVEIGEELHSLSILLSVPFKFKILFLCSLL